MDGPITIENQIKLNKNRKDICKDLEVVDISPALITSGVITPDEHDDLLKEETRKTRTEKLLSLLLAKDNKHFECFRVCLAERYVWLAEALANYKVTVEDQESHIGSIREKCSLPPRPKCFVGRERDVQEITSTFFTDRRRLAVIKAFGGQGKTALATEIGHTCVSKWGIRSVMADMKGVSHNEDIPLSLLHAIKPSPRLSSGKTDAARLTRMACEEISSYRKKMLIILDNCENALEDHTRSHFYSLLNQLLSSCNNAYVLCTTRQTIQIPNEEMLIHELGTLTMDNSFVVLQSYSQRLSREDGNHLAEKCGFVALLLHILGYLLQQGHKVIDIITELTSKTVFGLRLSPLMPEGLNATACINLSYERLGQGLQDAVQILSLFPTSFNAEVAFNLLTKHQSSLSMFDCSNCLQTLCHASFLQYDATNETYAMHGVIKAFAQEKTSLKNVNRFREMFMALMEHRIDHIYTLASAEKGRAASTFFENDKDNLLVCIAIFESMHAGSKTETYNLAKKLAFSLRQIGRFSDSLRCFKLALETVKEEGQETENPDLAFLYYNIGYLQGELGDSAAAVENLSCAISEYEKQGERCYYKDYCKCCYYLSLRLNEAKENHARCLEILKKCFDKAVAHQDLSMQYLAKAGIAGLKARQGEKEEAVMSILHDILKADPGMDGKENGVGMDALNDAAIALNLIGKNVEALSLYRRSVAVAEDFYGEHPETAIVLTNMGSFMVKTGDVDGAIENLRKAIAMRENKLGFYHKHTAASMHRLANAISAQGNHSEALSTFQRALSIKEQVLGECQSTVYTLMYTGFEMVKLGNADGFVDILKKALVMIENTPGTCCEGTAAMLYELADKIAEQGYHADALSAYQLALHILEKVLGENLVTAAVLNRIGHEKMMLGKAEDAEDFFRRALVMDEKTLGEYHTETAKTIFELAYALSAQGKFTEALTTIQRALHVFDQLVGDHSIKAVTLGKIGDIMLKLGKVDDALNAFKSALALREKLQEENDEQTAATLQGLAKALAKQGHHEEALNTFHRALHILEQIPREDSIRAITIGRLGQDMIELGYADSAVDTFKRALILREKLQDENDEQTAATLHGLANALSEQGNHEEALKTYQRAFHVFEQISSKDSFRASTLHRIGHEMSELGNADGAVDAFSRALALREKTLGEHHEDTADTLNGLACALSIQENHTEAVSKFQRALKIREKVLGESLGTACTLHNIGHELIDLGSPDEAEDFLRRAMAIREKILGEYHKETAETICELAFCISKQGNHAEALSTYKKALRIMEQVLGESQRTALALKGIGHAMIELGDAAGAVGVVIRALDMEINILGKEHEETVDTVSVLFRAISTLGSHGDAHCSSQTIKEKELGYSERTATILHNLGHKLKVMGNLESAVGVLRAALAMKEKILGEYDERTAVTIHMLATALSAQGNHQEALNTYQRALRIREKELGESKKNASTLHGIGQEKIHLGDLDDAVSELRRALSMKERIQGECHEDTATTMHELARALSAKGNHAEALGTFQRALGIKEQVLGESESTASTLYCIGHELIALGDVDGAGGTLNRALAMREKVHGENHKETAATLHQLALCISAQGNHTEALDKYKRALRVFEQVLGESHDTASALYGIGHEMIELGDAAGAVDVLIRALAMENKILAEDHELTLVTISELARAISILGNQGDTHSPAQRIKEKELDYSEGTATKLHNIGYGLKEIGILDAAVGVLRVALIMKERLFGEYSENTAVTINMLATAMSAQGNHMEALNTCQRALCIYETVLGESLKTASTLHVTGQERMYLGNLDNAVADLRRALSMKEKIQGEYHQDTATTMYELARAMSAQGNHAEALNTFQRALVIEEKVLGESQSTASTLHCIGHEWIALSKINDAENTLRRALAMQEKILGKHHKDTAETLHDLAFCISAQGNHREALNTYQKAFRIMEQVLGESQSTASALHGIGHEKIELGDATGAVDVLGRALAMREKTLGKFHYQTLATKFELLRALSIQGNADVPSAT